MFGHWWSLQLTSAQRVVEGDVPIALESGLDLVFIECKEILKAHTHTKRQLIEAAFCFLPTHLSCSQ